MAISPVSLANTEKAARAHLNRLVREKTITRQTANTVLKFALPFVPKVLADARLSGWSAERVTEHFQAKRAQAAEKSGQSAQLGIVCADLYLVMWAGLQVDYAEFANSRTPASRAAETPELGAAG